MNNDGRNSEFQSQYGSGGSSHNPQITPHNTVEKVRLSLGFEGMVSVDANGHSGGLAFFVA